MKQKLTTFDGKWPTGPSLDQRRHHMFTRGICSLSRIGTNGATKRACDVHKKLTKTTVCLNSAHKKCNEQSSCVDHAATQCKPLKCCVRVCGVCQSGQQAAWSSLGGNNEWLWSKSVMSTQNFMSVGHGPIRFCNERSTLTKLWLLLKNTPWLMGTKR